MEHNKENAVFEFIKMIRASWTYDRMTTEEKRRVESVISGNITADGLRGTFSQRWNTLNAIYDAFLCGLGYTGGAQWREPENADPVPLF